MFLDLINDDELIETEPVDLSRDQDRPPDPAVIAAQAGRTLHPPTTSRNRRRGHGPVHRVRGSPDVDTGIDAYTIDQFCTRHGISKSFFFALMAEGRGPRVMRVGRRTLISREAAAAWRRRQERSTKQIGMKVSRITREGGGAD